MTSSKIIVRASFHLKILKTELFAIDLAVWRQGMKCFDFLAKVKQ